MKGLQNYYSVMDEMINKFMEDQGRNGKKLRKPPKEICSFDNQTGNDNKKNISEYYREYYASLSYEICESRNVIKCSFWFLTMN